MIIANAKNMRNDILISGSVLVGLFFTYLLNMPSIDLIVALLVSLWIIKVAWGIFKETNVELMDGVGNTDIYDKIFQAIEEIEGVSNPHRIRVRKLANLFLVAMDIEVDKNLRLYQAHDLSKKVENKIRELVPNIYDILIHIEPEGNIEKDEVYGISKESIIPKD
jgi:cation diffusion facilitator family transporter